VFPAGLKTRFNLDGSMAEDERQKYGGQAVVEGVMMRSPRHFAVACRRETDGLIVLRVENVESSVKGLKFLDKPFLRGSLALIDSLMMGYKALAFSAGVQIEAEAESAQGDSTDSAPALKLSKEQEQLKSDAAKPINNITIGATTAVAMVIALCVFWGLPTLASQGFQHWRHWTTLTWGRDLELNLIDAVIRIALFLGYIVLISRMNHVQRIFQYHGAEHKSINTLEAGLDLTVENARGASRIHPRCGTNFIFIVLVVHFLVIALFGRPIAILRVLISIAMLPVVAGISFEILKWAGRNRDKFWANMLISPGLALQLLTTRVPDDSQIEVALESLKAVWDKEHEQTDSESEPQPEEPAAAVA
jgi:uncharacterized protein YqhQ